VRSAVVKRSIVIAGHKTSISLEDEFWDGLKEIARARGMTSQSWSPRLMPIGTAPIYRQLFDFLCLVSIAIRMRRDRPRQTLRACTHKLRVLPKAQAIFCRRRRQPRRPPPANISPGLGQRGA
jgi:hypothetical protein